VRFWALSLILERGEYRAAGAADCKGGHVRVRGARERDQQGERGDSASRVPGCDQAAEGCRPGARAGPDHEGRDSAERVPFMRLFFEVYTDAMAHPGTYSQQGHAMVTEWLDQFGAALAGTPAGDASATLVIAVLRGLLLDRLSTGDTQRTDRALELFTQLIARQS
jgi:hypothetical protein